MRSCGSGGARARRTRPNLAGNRTVEIVWTVIPCVIVIALFSLTAHTMGVADPPAPVTGPDLIVIGHQWWWEVRYPKSGVVTANEIHIPVGKAAVREAGGDRRAARVLGHSVGAGR